MRVLFFIVLFVMQVFGAVQKQEGASSTATFTQKSSSETNSYLIRPAINARPGIFRVFSADNFGGNTFTFAYHGEYHEDTDAPFDGENKFYREHIGINYGPTRYLEFFLERVSTVNTNEDYNYYGYARSRYDDDSDISVSFGDLSFGGKLTVPLTNDFKLGVEGSILTYTDIDGGSTFNGTSYGIRGLATLNLGRPVFSYGNPVLVHLNYQYLYNNSYDVIEDIDPSQTDAYRALGISRFDRMNYGAGIELQAGAINPFLEWNLSQPLSSRVEFSEYPNIITFGTKINPGKERRFSLNFALDLGLTQDDTYDIERTPRYKFNFGLAYILGGNRNLAKVEVEPSKVNKAKLEGAPVLAPVTVQGDLKQVSAKQDSLQSMKDELKKELRQEMKQEMDEQDMMSRLQKAQEPELAQQEEVIADKQETAKQVQTESTAVENENELEKEAVVQTASPSPVQNNVQQQVPQNNAPQIYFIMPQAGQAGQQVQAIPMQQQQQQPKAEKIKKLKKKPEVEIEKGDLVEEVKTTTTKKVYRSRGKGKKSLKKNKASKNVEMKQAQQAGVIPTTLPKTTKAQTVDSSSEDLAQNIKEEVIQLDDEEKEEVSLSDLEADAGEEIIELDDDEE